MPSLQTIREKLVRAQTMFCRAADTIPKDSWGQQPEPEKWSAAEVVAHLVAVERAVIGKADSVMRETPVEARIVRRKSPLLPMDLSLLAEKECMPGSLRSARERTFAFLEETQNRDLSAHYWKHPSLGYAKHL